MRKKIRQALAELSQECTALSQQEMKGVVGGDRYYFDSSGICTHIEVSNEHVAIVGNNKLALYGSLSGLNGTGDKCANITGDGVSLGLFEFLAQNTDVEWGYAYNAGESGGFLMTSNMEFQIELNKERENMVKGYEYCAHNHGIRPKDMPDWDAKEYNSLPSQKDLDLYAGKDMPQGQIYNELTGKYHNFNQNSKTQDKWIDEHEDYEAKFPGQW